MASSPLADFRVDRLGATSPDRLDDCPAWVALTRAHGPHHLGPGACPGVEERFTDRLPRIMP